MPTPDATARLAGRTAIVTGGGSGIGQAICLLLARHGARVAILDLDGDNTARQITAAGGSALSLRCDVSDQRAVANSFATVGERYGPLDVLVNSAGVPHIGSVETTTEE